MNNLEKYLDQVIEQKPTVYESPSQPPPVPKSGAAQAVLRRWYIAFFTTLVLCGAGLPAIWLSIKPQYVVSGAMNVSPVVKDILTGQANYGEATSYREFVNTQVAMLISGPTLHKIADDLSARNLRFFSGTPQTKLDKIKVLLGVPAGSPDPTTLLKDAISHGVIVAAHLPNTTLVAVTMKDEDPKEAQAIVDSFLQNYQWMYGVESLKEENATLELLETSRGELFNKSKDYHDQVKNLTKDYGTVELTARQEMELSVQTKLLDEHTNLEVQRIGLETKIALLEQTGKASMLPEQAVAASREYINGDPTVKELSASIVKMELDLVGARQMLVEGGTDLRRMEERLATFKKNLEDRKKDLEKEFYERLDKKLEEAAQQRLADAKAEYDQVLVHLQKIDERLSAQERKTDKIQRDNVDIGDIQFNAKINNDALEEVSRRLKTLQLQHEQRPRVTLAHAAEVQNVEDKRFKFMAVAALLSLFCGCGLALLRDKSDKTIQTPEDMSRQIGLPLLGTTTSSRAVRADLFAEQIAGDYQMIRTNLGLATSGGVPRRIAISSAGTKEGKTTFAVNLATSLAKAGKKVLLIDGDLRKPDVRYMLNLSNGSAGVQEVLLGEDPSQIVRTVPGSGLHVLVANSRNLTDVYELLTSPTAAEQIERLGRQYDHLIVDTPPALAFPDALVWAKLMDAVILVGFAGQTTSTEMNEAKERFTRVRARVLGTILSNVRTEQRLYRYNDSHVNHGASTPRKARNRRKLLLPPQGPQKQATSKDV
jgi:capsular exopolysaccharide synthesis family protein